MYDVTAPARNVARTLAGAFVILLVSLLWTVIIPGIIAGMGHVFYKDDVVRHLPPQAVAKLRVFGAEQKGRRQRLAAVETAIDRAIATGNGQALPGLLQLRASLQETDAAALPPISAIAFNLNPQLLLWPAIYACLGWLILILGPASEGSLRAVMRRRAFPALAFLLYVSYEWPLWIRNFVLNTEGRTVYAYPNIDVHPGSFFAQEAVVAGFCALLALLWLQWAQFYSEVRTLNTPVPRALPVALEGELVNEVSRLFTYWQICSVILALGFLFFTNFFWTLVAKFHDQRYFLSAIMAHLLWAVSWALISMPLISRWHYWSRVKRMALVELAAAEQGPEAPAIQKDVLFATKPFSDIGASLSGAASFVSFILPIIQLFRA